MRFGRTLLAVAAASLLATIGIANAETKTPSAQGLDSVDKNLAKQPDNRGLKNAQTRIEANQKRHALHKAAVAERVEKPARPERPDHPERPGR